MKRLTKTISFLSALLGFEKLPIEEGKLNLSEADEKKVIDAVGEKDFKVMVSAINKEAENVLKSKEQNKLIEEARAEFRKSLEENGYTEEEIKDMAKSKEANSEEEGAEAESDENSKIEALIGDFKSYQKKTDEMIAKLIQDPEPDEVHELNKNSMTNKLHSATHLFGEQSELNAFADRNWNRVAAGLTDKPTAWHGTAGELNLQKLNGDIELFYRENPKKIESLHRDTIELPSFWPTRFGVKDRVTDGRIMSDEITQARKLPWLPKNKQLIQPETRQVFDVSIDLEWAGHKLQQYEKSWIQSVMNMDGSNPYKMSFVQFLVTELMKKAKNEDRMSAVKGVYVPTPDDATTPGRAINRQDGLLYQLYKAIYVDKKVKVPSLGLATSENIVDYVRKNIETNLDEEIRENQNLVYYLSLEEMRLYIDRKEMLKGMYTTTKNKSEFETVDHYPNIRLEPLHDLAGTGVHIITFDDNIEILEDVPNEKGLLRFEMLKRMIYGHGDYKFGVGFIHLGTEVSDEDPDAFKVQTVWTNGVFPFKENFFIPFHDNKSGKLEVKYSNLSVAPEFATDITTLNKSNLFEGQIVRVKGDTSATGEIVNNSTFSLDSNFAFSTGGTLTMVVTSDLKLKEVKRTSSPSTGNSDIYEFDGDVIDMTNGTTQTFVGGATTLASIDNGVEQQKLTILNSGSANLTVSNVPGNVAVDTSAVIKPSDQLVLINIDGVWTEFSRDIS